MTEVLAFVNPKSGGGQGVQVLRDLEKLITSTNTINLSETDPKTVLEQYKNVTNFRILACGGDGTGRWILETIDKIDFLVRPSVGILPLGTGNDIARVFGWGGGYTGESVKKILDQVQQASVTNLDRWKIQISSPSKEDEIHFMNNYLSIGFADAKIALNFHKMREENPQLCKARPINKLWYISYGVRAFCDDVIRDITDMSQCLSLEVDDVPISLGSDLEGILVLNLPSYAGGSDTWGPVDPSLSGKYKHVSFNDGLVEVIGIKGAFHLGQIVSGMTHGVRLAQGRKIKIDYFLDCPPLPVKVDGEPWLQEVGCTFTIDFWNRVPMLAKANMNTILPAIGNYSCSGYLYKTSRRPKLRKRFFVLSDGKLRYFINQQSALPKGEMALPSDPEDVAADRSNPTIFTMLSDKNRYSITCPSEEERDLWVSAIKNEIERVATLSLSVSELSLSTSSSSSSSSSSSF
eukprot:TRINITY_DN16387_c0_g1_i2.p1 TRINITY_DN16387_c0_g1~~TRINITY_DN16387_c0_g1_i2.p1  ORF type:complete len:463 (+),score=179.30 TRINITY_DN16387_c0_g1_i2:60-1448(+)